MEILGNLSEMLQKGASVEFWANRPSKVFTDKEGVIPFGWYSLSNWYDIWQAGITLCQPRLGTVVKANKGIIYVCSRPAIPNKRYKPNSLHADEQQPIEFSAEWTELPDEIIFFIWPMRDYCKTPVRN
jgi:hypothetical protein